MGYILSYGTGSKSYSQAIDVGFTVTHTVKNLLADTAYCFAVRAYDTNGLTSDYSSEVCAKTDPTNTPTDPVEEPPPSSSDPDPLAPLEIVRYAWRGQPNGHWGVASSTGAADGKSMRSPDNGWSAASAPLTSPKHYFDLTFDARANTPYRLWLRLRAAGNSKWNDAVWVQFSAALVKGQPAYRIGTTSALLVNLEPCVGCSMRGWGWVNFAYWLGQETIVTFADSGTQTIRIQTREDGVEIDQVVLSAQKYLTNPPGPIGSDTTILAETSVSTSPPDDGTTDPGDGTTDPDDGTDSPTAPATSGTPFGGTPIAIPAMIEAAAFDNGASGVAYWDSTTGNSGGQLRSTDVDIERASDGGYNIGWTNAGEWLTYSVNVTQSGAYTLLVRVASVGGGTLEFSATAPSSKTVKVAVPDTRGWQNWTNIKVPITLAAGKQVFRIRFATGGINFRKFELRR